MKIISGKYKNLIVPTIKEANYRPTSSKIREALFSIIASGELANFRPLVNANVLDLFAGSGIFSFEALSRGANSATLIDINSEYMKLAQFFAKKIGVEDKVKFNLMDVNLLQPTSTKYDIVFMDPPYYNNLCSKTLDNLLKHDWLNNKAIIIMETEKAVTLSTDKMLSIKLIREKKYGNSKLLIAVYDKN